MKTILSVLISVATAGCLTTPPGVVVDGGAVDAEVAAADAVAPDAVAVEEPVPDQLLAIALWGYPQWDSNPGTLVLRRQSDGSWYQITDGAGPDWNFNDVDWGDCCGIGGVADGVPELLASSWNGPFVYRLEVDEAEVRVRPPLEIAVDDVSGEEAHSEWIDLDGDGDLDAITGNPTLRLIRNSGTTFTEEAPPLEAGHHVVAAGNWDDDPEAEVAVVDGASVRVFERGAGAWDVQHTVEAVGASNALWCDLAGDDHLDLLVATAQAVTLYINQGRASAGNWLDAGDVRRYGGSGMSDTPMVCGDLDGDGNSDALFSHGTEGIVVISHGASGAQPLTNLGDDEIHGLELADVDRDGHLDVFAALRGDDVLVQPAVVLLINQTEGPGDFDLGPPATILENLEGALDMDWIAVAPGILPPLPTL